MRITNVMISNSKLGNINRNQRRANTLLEQLSTGRQISTPSQNPLMATRHMRMENSLNQISQHRRNVEHAQSWTEVTEQATRELTAVMQRLEDLLTRADALESLAERRAFAQEMDSLLEQKQSIMNRNVGGRYIFSGLRTNHPPFLNTHAPDKAVFNIVKSFSAADVERTWVMDRSLANDASQHPDASSTSHPQMVDPDTGQMMDNIDVDIPTDYRTTQISRIRLPHNANGGVTIPGLNVVRIDPDFILPAPHEGQIDFAGLQHFNFPANTVFHDGRNGEVFAFDAAIFDTALTHTTPPNTTDQRSFNVIYNQVGFEAGDLNPLVYFNSTLWTGEVPVPNPLPPLTADNSIAFTMDDQEMPFEFGIFNQMPMNLLAANLFTGTMFADIRGFTRDILALETTTLSEAERRFRELDPTATDSEIRDRANAFLAREASMLETVTNDRFNNKIGRTDVYMRSVAEQHTDIGTRMRRLDLISERLEDDNVTFQTLSANNIGVDIAEAVMRLTTAEVSLTASLQAGMHQVMNMTLLNFL